MAGSLVSVETEAAFDELVKSSPAAVVHFWAPWCEPCKQLDQVLEVLAKDHQGAFLRVEAEEVTEVSLRYEVAVVPLFLFFKDGKLVDKLEGADVAALSGKVAQHCPAKAGASGKQAASVLAPSNGLDRLAPGGTAAATEKVKALIHSQPVMLFMKGSPDAPRCGFSSRVVAVLQKLGVPFGHFDILTDEAVRQAAKVYSDWPSYPQLYVRGDLVGGCDIVEEMDASGELEDLLKSSTSGKTESLQERLQKLVTSSNVMLFMKGSPQAPRCGFSSKAVQALDSIGVKFGHFDILEDQEVREGLKKFSQWPTYPQLYAGGELLGGCDIVLELFQRGELKGEIESQLAESSKKAVAAG